MRQVMGTFSAFVVHQKVYVSEAHPLDGWAMYGDIDYNQPTSIEERINAACNLKSEDKKNLMIDNMRDEAERAYSAHPERLFVVDRAGKLVYKGGMGPDDYNPIELKKFLIQKLVELEEED